MIVNFAQSSGRLYRCYINPASAPPTCLIRRTSMILMTVKYESYCRAWGESRCSLLANWFENHPREHFGFIFIAAARWGVVNQSKERLRSGKLIKIVLEFFEIEFLLSSSCFQLFIQFCLQLFYQFWRQICNFSFNFVLTFVFHFAFNFFMNLASTLLLTLPWKVG